MGLDYGSKTVGVAISDPLGLTAQGIETICRKMCIRDRAYPITLGKRILRTETAGMTMLSVLMYHLEQE